MSWTSGAINSTTPATALYNALVAQLTSWTVVETVSAATAGTVADVKVLRAPGSDWYLLIEVDDTNARLRFRAAREYDATTKQIRKHCPNTATGTAYTPAADYSAGTAWVSIGSGTSGVAGVIYVQVPVLSGVAFNYYIGVGQGNGSAQDLIYVATDVASGGNYGFVIVGFFTPVNPNDFPLFIAAASGLTGPLYESTGSIRLAYEYSYTTSLTGAFTGMFGPLAGNAIPPSAGAPYSTRRNPYTTNGIYLFDVLMHGNSSSITSVRFYRGYLPHFKAFVLDTAVAPGDTITVGSTSYFVIGCSSSSNNVGLCVDKASAF